MGFKKWLKGATRIRFDDRTLGNLTKNAAVAGGTLVGGPLGLAIGGLGSAAGQAALPGSNLGSILKGGLKGAGTTGLLQAGKGLIGNAIGGGGAPGIASAPGVENAGNAGDVGNALPSAATDSVAHGGLSLPSVPNLATAGGPAVDPRGILSKALDTGKSVAGWAGDHDRTSSALLSGLGDALNPNDERLQRAQIEALTRRTDEDDYAFQRRKASDLALEPLRQALYGGLGGQIASNNASVAANPYNTGGR